ncbi:hypothetical protein RDABS01_010363 [Bienertia sinuspersici]
MGKYIWSVACKEDNLWVKWIDHVYLKGKDWRIYMPNSTVSWYWRQLTHIKDKFRTGYSGDRWMFDKKGYTASSGYEWLRNNQNVVGWSKWVWNRLNIPKHSFMCWVIMWDRLQTRDKLRKIGIQVENHCPMCGLYQETADHLLVQCSYVRKCTQELNRSLKLFPQFQDLDSMSNWLNRPTAGRVRCQVVQATSAALLYNIWIQRNKAICQGCLQHYNSVVKQIKSEVWMRIQGIMPKKVQDRDREWIRQSLM